ncbi:MAG TPA: thioredoxin domain-containing protein [Rhizomicrobium sp.]
MSRNQILLGILVLALLALGAIAWYAIGDKPDTPAVAVVNGAAGLPAGYERTLGSPTAPIKMIEYAAPMCPICAAFDMREFPRLKSQYIDTGKVFYIFRVFPIGAPDLAVEGIARCLPSDQYFTFIDTMYRNQDKWDPDGHDIADVRAAIVAMAGRTGMSSDEAARCMDDKTTEQRTLQVAQDATSRFGVNGTPTFIIDGEPVYSGEYPWDLLKDQLDRRLAK